MSANISGLTFFFDSHELSERVDPPDLLAKISTAYHDMMATFKEKALGLDPLHAATGHIVCNVVFTQNQELFRSLYLKGAKNGKFPEKIKGYVFGNTYMRLVTGALTRADMEAGQHELFHAAFPSLLGVDANWLDIFLRFPTAAAKSSLSILLA